MEKKREFYKIAVIFEVNGVANRVDGGLRYGVVPDNYVTRINDFATFVKRAEELGYEVSVKKSLFGNKETKSVKVGWDKITEKKFALAVKTVVYTRVNPTCSYLELAKTLPHYQMMRYIKDNQYPNRYLKG